MKNLFGEEIKTEEAKQKVEKVKKEKKIYTLSDYDIYSLTDEEYIYFFCAYSHGHAKSLYFLMSGYDSFEWTDISLSINKHKEFKEYIREQDLGLEASPFNNDYWLDVFYKTGCSMQIHDDSYDYHDISKEEYKKLEEDGDNENTSLRFKIK